MNNNSKNDTGFEEQLKQAVIGNLNNELDSLPPRDELARMHTPSDAHKTRMKALLTGKTRQECVINGTLPRHRKRRRRFSARAAAAAAVAAVLLLTGGVALGSNIHRFFSLDVENMVNPDRSLFAGETLTIATGNNAFNLRQFANSYMSQNEGATIRIIDYMHHWQRDGHYEEAQRDISQQLTAGSSPVLIDDYLVDFHDPQSALYFHDWFPVMTADPDFNEDDWFMNLFHAAAVNGRLYGFPTSFSYFTVAANSTVPGLHEALTGNAGGITVPELLRLHRDAPAGAPLYIEAQFDVDWVRRYALGSFVDMETGMVNFGEEFAELIDYARSNTEPGGAMGWQGEITRAVEERWSGSYFYHLTTPAYFDYFLDYEESRLFTGMTHIVNESGELLVRPENSYVLSANATPVEQALAWDFMHFMMKPENQPGYGYIPMQPTNRALLRLSVEQEIPYAVARLTGMHGWRISGTAEESAISVASKMTAYGDMPMRNVRSLPGALYNRGTGIVSQALTQFQEGTLSADQTARKLQEQVTLMLEG